MRLTFQNVPVKPRLHSVPFRQIHSASQNPVKRSRRSGLFSSIFQDLVFAPPRLLNPFDTLQPPADYATTIADLGKQDILITTRDGHRLSGWYFPAELRPDETVLVFPGSVCDSRFYVDKIQFLHRVLGSHIYIFDYRGIGLSTGKPRLTPIMEDMEWIYQRLIDGKGLPNGTPSSGIIFFGVSFGGAMALDLATRVQTKAVITHAAFHSFRHMRMGRRIPWFHRWAIRLLGPFVDDRLENVRKFSYLQSPCYCGIHSENDRWYSRESLEHLIQAAREAGVPALKLLAPRGGHRQPHGDLSALQIQHLRRFIDSPSAFSPA